MAVDLSEGSESMVAMTHDPMCPKTLHEHEHDDYTYYCQDRGACEAQYPCQCDLIAEVRADERNKIFTTLDKMADSAHTDDCRDLTCAGCAEVVAQRMQKQ